MVELNIIMVVSDTVQCHHCRGAYSLEIVNFHSLKWTVIFSKKNLKNLDETGMSNDI